MTEKELDELVAFFSRGIGKDYQAPEEKKVMTGETFNLCVICAVHDMPFVMIFIRQPNGKYCWKESVKIGGKKDWKAYAVSEIVLRLDQVEGRYFPCAWCKGGGINHCAQDCGAFVCGGRRKNGTFTCRDSCGATWDGIPLDVITGETTQECLVSPVQNMTNPKLKNQSTALARVEPLTAVRKSWWKK